MYLSLHDLVLPLTLAQKRILTRNRRLGLGANNAKRTGEYIFLTAIFLGRWMQDITLHTIQQNFSENPLSPKFCWLGQLSPLCFLYVFPITTPSNLCLLLSVLLHWQEFPSRSQSLCIFASIPSTLSIKSKGISWHLPFSEGLGKDKKVYKQFNFYFLLRHIYLYTKFLCYKTDTNIPLWFQATPVLQILLNLPNKCTQAIEIK